METHAVLEMRLLKNASAVNLALPTLQLTVAGSYVGLVFHPTHHPKAERAVEDWLQLTQREREETSRVVVQLIITRGSRVLGLSRGGVAQGTQAWGATPVARVASGRAQSVEPAGFSDREPARGDSNPFLWHHEGS